MSTPTKIVRRTLADFPPPTPQPTPCRLWQGSLNCGYGRMRDGNRIHRWVVAQINGWDAIEGKVVMHKCDQPLCYRYDHLQIGTHGDNVRDASTKGRLTARGQGVRKTHCIRGHEFSDENTFISSQGKRGCKKCRVIRQREWLERNAQ